MNYKKLNNLLPNYWLLLLLLALFSVDMKSQSFVLEMPGTNMNFFESNRTVITDAGNGGKNAGSVHRYDNLIVANGYTIYGILTVKEAVNASIGAYFDDDRPSSGLASRFQPQITTTATGGYVLYELEFFEIITDQRVYVSDYYLTGMDIDGSEFFDIGGFSSYELDNSSQLTVTYNPTTGRTKFGGISGNLDGLTFENTAAFVARYNFPYTKVEFALGKDGATQANRQFSLQFGTVGGLFTAPLSTYNPKRLLDIRKTANSSAFKAGTNYKYTITIENTGAVAKNVVLTDTLPAGISYVPNSTSITIPSANVIESVFDNFNLSPVSYSVNNGTVQWKTNWVESGDDNLPATGVVRIATSELNIVAPGNNVSVKRGADLSLAQSATLSFKYRTTSLSGEIRIQISSDGSNFQTIGAGALTGTKSSTDFSISLDPSYLTSDFTIRFINNSGSSITGTAFIDDIKVEYFYTVATATRTNSTGGTLTNGVAPNLLTLADNITLHPGVKATLTFDVSVDCNAKDSIINTAWATCDDMYKDFVYSTHAATVNPTAISASGCASDNIDLTASGASASQDYKWYNAPSGGTLLQTGGSTYTANVTSTTDYYVSFYNTTTGCESGRTKVTATVSNSSPTGTGVISSPTGRNGATNPSTNATQAGTATNNSGAGNIAWSTPSNAIGSDDNRATAALTSTNTTTQNLDLTNFGFAIPQGSTILGITASIERSATVSSSARDNQVQLIKGGAIAGNNLGTTTAWPTSEASVSYGSSSNLWGTTWTPADINASNFGIRIRAERYANSPTVRIDNVTITVTYSAFGDDQSSVRFVVTGISNATNYTWSVPTNATITSGQGTSEIFVNFNNAVATGTHSVCVTPSNECSAPGSQVCYTIAVVDNVNLEIAGTVFYDPDGSNGSTDPSNKVGGTPISTIAGQQLYALLVDHQSTNNNTVVAAMPINPNGTYKFSYLLSTANKYAVWISNQALGTGTTANNNLPAGASFNGEISNNAANSITGNDGNSNGRVINLTAGNALYVNFGLLLSNPVANDDTGSTNEDTPQVFNVLNNDTDPNGNLTINVASVDLDPNTAGRQTSITNEFGTWNVNDAGLVTYTPVADFYGTATVNYVVKDGDGYQSDVATLTVTVNPVNDAPSFTKGSDITIDKNAGAQTVNGWVTAISKGPSNESLQTVQFIMLNDNNMLFSVQPSISPSGVLTYTPAPGAYGTVTVYVKIKDDGGTANGGVDESVYQSFTITINNTNDKPYAINDINTTYVNKTSTGNVLTNDVDPNGDVLTVTPQTGAATTNGGTVTLLANGTYTYTPANNFTGDDSFTYEVCDNGSPSLCSTATVFINVMPLPNPSANDAPVAVNDAFVGSGNTTLTGQVLSNDMDADGNTLTVTAALVDSDGDGNADDALTLGSGTTVYGTNEAGATVVAGTLTQNANGTLSFVPAAGFYGTVTYSYTASDGTATDTAEVTLYITSLAANTTIAVNDSRATQINTQATGNVLSNDRDNEGDALTVTSTGVNQATAQGGQITLNADGSYTYTPASNFTGVDSFTYTITDDGSPVATSQATIYFDVYPAPTGGNDAPVALNDAYVGAKGVTQTGNVLINDLDPDSNPLTVTAALVDADGDGNADDALTLGVPTQVYGKDASNATVVAGTLTLNADGTFSYVPHAGGFTGTVNYIYTASDGSLTDTANVKMTVTGTNTTTAVDDSFMRVGTGSVAVSGNVLANDSDVNGDTQTVNTTPVTAPQNGQLTLNANGTFSYTPNSGFTGTDWFVYEVCDDGTPSSCSRATVYINIPTLLRSCVISNKNVTTRITR